MKQLILIALISLTACDGGTEVRGVVVGQYEYSSGGVFGGPLELRSDLRQVSGRHIWSTKQLSCFYNAGVGDTLSGVVRSGWSIQETYAVHWHCDGPTDGRR